MTGRRPSMEDRVIHFDDLNDQSGLLSRHINRAMYAVYDGHAGDEVAAMAGEHVHQHIMQYLASQETADDVLKCLDLGVHSADEYINSRANAESPTASLLIPHNF